MVVSFLNVFLLIFIEFISVIMGVNIGIIIMVWFIIILGFKVSMSVIVLLLVGFGFVFIFLKKVLLKNWGVFIIGFFILFIGL